MPGSYDSGYGFWPALWILSQETCWPEGSEFDIMEFRGASMGYANSYYHYAPAGDQCGTNEVSNGCGYQNSESFGLDYHVFALEWNTQNATWYIDDIAYCQLPVSSLGGGITAFDPAPHYFIINFAVGGSYPGTPDDTTVFPAYLSVDYVRFYVQRTTCNGACSGHGCCSPSTLLCTCNNGWAGSNCEYYVGSFVDNFVSTNVQYTPATDVAVNGWGNGVTLYLATNTAINNGLTLTLTNASCPGACGNMDYSGGGWTSAQYYGYGTFSFYAKGSNVPGTGFSVGAAGASSSLEQIIFQFTGENPKSVQLISWETDYEYVQATVNLGFDSSAGYHNYSFVYAASHIAFSIDGSLKYNATVVIPTGTLALGAYYSADPAWYGGTFNYEGESSVHIQRATWLAANIPATC